MKQQQVEDEQLGIQVAAGDEQSRAAFFVLYERYADLSLAFITARVPAGQVADLHQDLWLKAWDKATSFQQGSYKAWLLSVARNQIIDFYRARARKKERADEHLDTHTEENSTPLHDMIDQETKQILQDCIGELDGRSATVLKRRLNGDSYRNICQELKLTENAAHKVVFNAKSQLKDCVEGKTQ